MGFSNLPTPLHNNPTKRPHKSKCFTTGKSAEEGFNLVIYHTLLETALEEILQVLSQKMRSYKGRIYS